MICNRCGSALPSEGYVCKVCGALMDEEQIKVQKENMKSNPNRRPKRITEEYGKTVEYNVENQANGALKAAVMLIIIVFLVLVSLIIFLVKR